MSLNIKSHLAFALKVLIAFIVVNAILELIGMFTSTSWAQGFIYKPLTTLGLNKGSANTAAQ